TGTESATQERLAGLGTSLYSPLFQGRTTTRVPWTPRSRFGGSLRPHVRLTSAFRWRAPGCNVWLFRSQQDPSRSPTTAVFLGSVLQMLKRAGVALGLLALCTFAILRNARPPRA